MNNTDLTIVITTFRSEKKIFTCLDSIESNTKIIVIENSNNINFQKNLENKYKNLKCFLTGNNHGYAKGNNIGLSKVETKYALVLNPDTVIEKKSLENFFITAKKYPEFSLIGPAYENNVTEKKIEGDIIEVENLKGFAIFINMQKFKDKSFFDENYFLYFEDIDLCKKVKKDNGTIFLDSSIKIKHLGAESVDLTPRIEIEKNRNWHWMWSTFYFHKKHYNFAYALLIITPKFLSSLFKLLLYTIVLNKKKTIYLFRLKGIINGVVGRNSWYRPS